MKTDFKCPHCANLLNVGENIVFSTRNRWGGEGLILLHPGLGNYEVIRHPAFEAPKGEVLQFFCPYCNKELGTDRHKNLVKILMTDDTGQEFEIYFSRIAGEHATYKLTGRSVEIFGEDASEYLDALQP